MRRVLDEQTYLDFNPDTSLKVVRDYRAKYAWIDECLDANPLILWLVHEDMEALSESKEGREAKYTTEILFRALIVHQIEKTPLRETIIRIAESPTLQSFIRLGTRSVPDFTFLNRAFKAITAETWKLVNEELAGYAVKQCEIDVSQIRADTTVIEANIHYPTDSSLLWDSYRVLSRLLRKVRAEAPELCPHRFHDKKAKKDLVYVNRYIRSGSKARKREAKRRFRRLHDAVCRLRSIAGPLPKTLVHSGNLALRGLGAELAHYLPLIKAVCEAAERAGLKGQTVPEEKLKEVFGQEPSQSPASQEQRTLTLEELEQQIKAFFAYLDQQDYVQTYQLKDGTYQQFRLVLKKLTENQPTVTEETASLYNLYRNMAYFFRVLGKKRVNLTGNLKFF